MYAKPTPLAHSAQVSRQMKHSLWQSPGWAQLDCTQKEMVEVIVHCLGHIAGGGAPRADAWQAIAHHAKLAERELLAAQGAAE